jgi:hypothetical protein
MRTARRFLGIVLVGLAAAAVPVPAEVGVALGSGAPVPVSYVIVGITDDPEPVGNAWIRYSVEGTGRKVLNEEGFVNGDGPPSLVVAGDVPTVAWARNSPAGYDIVTSRFVAGDWTAPQVVVASPENELDPFLVVNPADQSVHLLYWVDDGTQGVLVRQAPPDLSSWGPPVQVSYPGEIAVRPSAAFHDGVLKVAYEVHDFGFGTTPRHIIVATRVGEVFTSEQLATTSYSGATSPIAHSASGTFWVDWADAEGEMAWTSEQPSGSWLPVEAEPFATCEERDFLVRGGIRRQALGLD